MNPLITSALRFGSAIAFTTESTVCPEAEASLAALLEGNAAYLSHSRNPASLTDLIRVKTAHEGQHPHAVVVCCADSRVPPEHIFSAGIGDLFVIRNAGNLMTPAALGSVEYAVGHLHVPLVLVMGHRGCGAVASALVHGQGAGHEEEASLNELISQVHAGIRGVHDPKEAELHNLQAAVRTLGESRLLRRLAAEGKAGIACGMYDIRTGSVSFLRE